GAARALFAMGRDAELPSSLGRLHPRFGVPWRAMHLVHLVSLVGIVSVVAALRGRILDAYIWWAGPIVFFGLITYAAVNVSNAVYFRRFAAERFHLGLNGALPAAGVGMALYLIYKSFLAPLWSAPTVGGKSAAIVAVTFTGAAGLYALLRRKVRESD